ncbi:DNA-binding XRE family transcriptional regulator [Pseudomonas koreensis]|uniref:hypothetical protein n=1 Tax=Pseudomonas koreensis TaxID=198620 RepID=UPI002862FE42|nr:hypothetical protein [Pseudomonas koreensis]MDR7052945.1 DNA-binding XRE family transcriptional regulator [Pseudomonas koreensis]
MNQNKKWKEQARSILADYKEGRIQGALTQNALAQQVAVSRQTLWRDEEIRSLYAATHAHINEVRNSGRKNRDARIFSLEAQLERARAENNRLIQSIIKAAQLMTENAIDPRSYFDDATT